MELRPEEQDRADVYALVSVLLLCPDEPLLDALAAIPAPPDPANEFAQAWSAVIDAAARCGHAALAEYADLFVAAGTPRIDPYQCKYLAGWLMDKPLAELRDDLGAAGLGRAPGATELEDHLGVLCEAMALLVRQQRPVAMQRAFFADHLAGWSQRCLEDIANAPGADFYRAVARFAQAFLALEEEAFALDLATTGAVAPIRTRKNVPTSST